MAKTRLDVQKSPPSGMAGFSGDFTIRFQAKASLLRRSGSRRGGGGAAVIVRNRDRDSRNDDNRGTGNQQRAQADFLRGLHASGLTRRQGAISGESRRTNHRCRQDRSNNTLRTKNRCPHLCNGRHTCPKPKASSTGCSGFIFSCWQKALPAVISLSYCNCKKPWTGQGTQNGLWGGTDLLKPRA